MEDTKQIQSDCLEMRITLSEMKTILNWITSSLDKAKEKTDEL